MLRTGYSFADPNRCSLPLGSVDDLSQTTSAADSALEGAIMRKLTIIYAVLALASSAHAADFLVKSSAPAPLATYDWSGIYVGANGGYGWGDAEWDFPRSNYYTTRPSSFDTSPSGALVGGQIGINRQIGSYVFGVEVTADWADLKQSVVGTLDHANFPGDVWTTKLKDLETFSGRFGYAFNNWQVYGKAGGATGGISVDALSGPPGAGITYSETKRLWGVTAGGGIEYGLTSNITVGVEYDFTRLFAGQFNGLASNGASVSFGAKSSFDVQSVLARVSYKF
jgi:outer membrane immunogenic protein